MLQPKIHYDLTQIVVACGLYSNYVVLVQYNLQCKMLLCVNSTYFCFKLTVGVNYASLHCTIKVRIQWQRQAFFPLALWACCAFNCAASRLLV